VNPIDNPASVPWWRWLNIFALDAPLIAVFWQRVLMVPAAPTSAESLALFFAVWAVYLADRLLDARAMRLLPAGDLPYRHRIFRRYWRGGLVALGFSVAAGIGCAFFLSAETMIAGCVLGLVVTIYLFGNQWAGKTAAWRWAKEAVIATIFAVGCGLSAVGTISVFPWLAGVAGLASVGWLNCLQIASLERAFDLRIGKAAMGAESRFRRAVFTLIPGILVGGAFLYAMAGFAGSRGVVAMGGAASMLAFTGLVAARRGSEAGGAWADAALLGPAVIASLV
jgi:hypothetical protein